MTPQTARIVIEALAWYALGQIAGVALFAYLTRPRELISLDLREEPGDAHEPAMIERDAA
jgi:hypothetical protein